PLRAAHAGDDDARLPRPPRRPRRHRGHLGPGDAGRRRSARRRLRPAPALHARGRLHPRRRRLQAAPRPRHRAHGLRARLRRHPLAERAVRARPVPPGHRGLDPVHGRLREADPMRAALPLLVGLLLAGCASSQPAVPPAPEDAADALSALETHLLTTPGAVTYHITSGGVFESDLTGMLEMTGDYVGLTAEGDFGGIATQLQLTVLDDEVEMVVGGEKTRV